MVESAATDARHGPVAAGCSADAPPLAPGATIDRAHLARMTQGEPGLDREVLQLYATQAELLLTRMRGLPPAAVAALAHTLNGSSRGIGAWQVADAAAAIEADVAAGHQPVLERLVQAVRAAQHDIADMLRHP